MYSKNVWCHEKLFSFNIKDQNGNKSCYFIVLSLAKKCNPDVLSLFMSNKTQLKLLGKLFSKTGLYKGCNVSVKPIFSFLLGNPCFINSLPSHLTLYCWAGITFTELHLALL